MKEVRKALEEIKQYQFDNGIGVLWTNGKRHFHFTRQNHYNIGVDMFRKKTYTCEERIIVKK